MSTRAPGTLTAAGKRLWRSIADHYVLRPDELATLEDACKVTDLVTDLETAWAQDGRQATTQGSMGQQVIHPLIGEIRAQRMARNALWRQLKLPDDDAGVPSNQQRDAANAKWAAGRGRGA